MTNLGEDDYLGPGGLGVLALSLLPDIPGASVRSSATLTWRCENWTSITGSMRSPAFTCSGMNTKWRLLLYPRDGPSGAAPDSVCLYLDRGDYGKTADLEPLCIQFCCIISQVSNPMNFIYRDQAKRMGGGDLLCGFERFCSEDQIIESPYGGDSEPILEDNEVDVTVYLRVMKDPHKVLWLCGVPSPSEFTNLSAARPPSTAPSPTSSATPSVASSQESLPIQVFEPPVASTSAPREPVRERTLPPCRAAYPGEECMVCADEPLLFPLKSPTLTCTHEARICLPCLQSHIASELTGKGAIRKIICPAPDCPQVLEYNEIQYWAEDGTFKRYDRMLARAALGGEENFILCTNPTCDAGQIHTEGVNAPIVTCYVCHHKTCFLHQIAWHDGMSCEEWDERQRARNGTTNDDYIKKYTKPCPHCSRPIEKSEGCDAMTCKLPAGCGHAFCWLCFAPYEIILRDGNHRHKPSCKHYAAYDDPNDPDPAESSAGSASLWTSASTSVAPTPASSGLSNNDMYDVPEVDFTPTTIPPYTPPTANAGIASTALNVGYDVGRGISSVSGTPGGTLDRRGKKWYRFWKDR
ncbi:hypothetical protein FRC14_002425 [Serendipita sp. 396]|nr:hypothetical protein FRC14_002425 [Serendipita sp. 396]KAG8784398.1 hypothetical protein FRC15_003304 [Serendipita sp. 397]KAG8800236.1 hypothetical protein FRC16_003329 [Serendipita sp. 398]KAG8824013.1 hypothetical protein FRC19_002742 [Serendipita sp. 401]KAG8859147.1 hypothetical protein FRB91_008823 [Serendipita sp. 411]KAG8868349.1 hypothetical protein FRC20_003559 [Serendipita sp. 405]KAG9057076.1 hypothetical protein FS842_008647 [Serendipita sp. 407]